MKKIFVVLSLLLTAAMLFAGCGKTDNSAPTTTFNNLPNQQDTRTGTLQGKIMNALTGAPLGNDADSTLQIWLIQGDSNRGATKLTTDNNDPLVGEYAFSGIPIDLYSGNAKFKVVVVKPGFQRFEANVELNDTLGDSTPVNSTLDSVINRIGNIYLFPLNATAGDVTIVVNYPQGTPLPGATVLLQQHASSNDTFTDTGDRLPPAGGLYTSLTTTTNDAGVATFKSADLTLGGAYSVVVLPVTTVGGTLLSVNGNGFFWVGEDPMTQVVTMEAENGVLFATSATNQALGYVSATGDLSVTFNQPIALTTTGFIARGLASDGTSTDTYVQATLSTDNMTMSLTLPPTSAITGTTANLAGSVVTYHPANSVTTFNDNNAIFIIKSIQQNSGLTFGSGTADPLQNINTNADVSKVVRQLQQ